jgi:dipeptidase E
MTRSLLLMSTSTVFGTGFLEHGFAELLDFLGRRKRVLFIPYAIADLNSYAAGRRLREHRLRPRLDPRGGVGQGLFDHGGSRLRRGRQYLEALESPL